MNAIRMGANLSIRAFAKTLLDVDDFFDGRYLTEEERTFFSVVWETAEYTVKASLRSIAWAYFVCVPMTCLMGLALKIAKRLYPSGN